MPLMDQRRPLDYEKPEPRKRVGFLIRGNPNASRLNRIATVLSAVCFGTLAVGLAILVGLFRSRQTVNLDEATLMRR